MTDVNTKMKKQRGGTITVLVVAVVLALVGASAWLCAGMTSRRSYKEGIAAYERGDYKEASALLERASKWALRDDARILFALGETKAQLKDNEAAKSCFAKVVALEPNNVKARYELGLIHIDQKNMSAAKEEIKQLELIGTDEACALADELKAEFHTGAVRGIIGSIVDKIAPGVREIFKGQNVLTDDSEGEELPASGDEGDKGYDEEEKR